MNNKYIKLNTDRTVEVLSGEGDKPELKLLQECVGGWIERVYVKKFDSKGIDLFCNEEGECVGLGYNATATHLQAYPDDYIVGNCVVAHDNEGESRWLTDDEVKFVLEAIGVVKEAS